MCGVWGLKSKSRFNASISEERPPEKNKLMSEVMTPLYDNVSGKDH